MAWATGEEVHGLHTTWGWLGLCEVRSGGACRVPWLTSGLLRGVCRERMRTDPRLAPELR